MFDAEAPLLRHFSTWLEPRVNQSTARYYLADVRQHLEWLGHQDLALEEVTTAHLEHYVSALRTVGPATNGKSAAYALTTVARKVSALREFYAVLFAQGEINANPALRLVRPRYKPTRNRQRPTHEGLQVRLPANEVPRARHIRDMAVVALATHEQLKVSEIVRLNTPDVDLGAGFVRVWGRPSRKSLVGMSQATSPLLARWLAARRLVGSGRDEAVFISLHWTSGRSLPGTRMSTRAVSEILRGDRGGWRS